MIKAFIELYFSALDTIDNMDEKDETTYHIVSWVVVIVLILSYFI